MLLDGKQVALDIRAEIEKQVSSLRARKPGLAFILVGENLASKVYVKAKQKACHATGMISKTLEFSKTITESELIKQIQILNRDPHIDGILVQLPLPDHISVKTITMSIDPKKDVDGFHPLNVGKMLLGDEDGFFPCTPLGIKVLLEKYQIETKGKHVVILGRSNIVGKPLAAMLMQKKMGCDATVTLAHSHSTNTSQLCRSADILVAALGKPEFVTKEFIKPEATVIDVGINRIPNGSLVGDVDFKQLAPLVKHITPVPGGIGPMTIAMLLQNTLLSFLKFAILLIVLASCEKKNSCTYFEGEAMSKPYEVVISKGLTNKEQKSVEKLIQLTFAKVQELFDEQNINSEVSKLNQMEANTLIPLSLPMQDFLKLCDEMVTLSGGRFDPTIQPLQDVWKQQKPSLEELQQACDATGWKHLSIQNGIFKKDLNTTRLDLSRAAMGVAIDWLVDGLQQIGLSAFMVKWGSNFRALGLHPNNRDWLIPISPAFSVDQKPMAPIALRNAALVVTQSSPSIIDPMTAAPLEETPFSVAFATVIAPTCAMANTLAISTLLFPTHKEAEQWAQEVVEKYPDVKFWILSHNNKPPQTP